MLRQERPPDGKPTPEAWQALRELREAYGSRLLNYAYYRIWDRAAAEDIIETAFFEVVLKSLADHPDHRPSYGWLKTVVYNKIRHYWEEHHRVQSWESTPDQEDSIQAPEERFFDAALVLGKLPRVEDVDARDLIERAMQQLTEHERKALYWHYELGLTAEAVAKILGIEPTSAAQLFWRATRNFRNVYKAMKNENA